MQLTATIANALWHASNLPAHARFRDALRDPELVQSRKLRAYLAHHARSAYGREHGFESIHNYEEFARRVPLTEYDALVPWVERIRRGEDNVLTFDRVTQLVPTSGSAGARKLIPFTAGLQREFNAAIGPWLVDLAREQPGLLGGPAYWSVTPALQRAEPEESAVAIGFDADTAYLGGVRRRLVDAAMAVPAKVQHAGSLEAFRYATLLHLLRCRELRLISVWHPSFFTLLLDALPEFRDRLIAALPERAGELRDAQPFEPESLWPELRVISCWGDGAAELALAGLRHRFPHVHIQTKGLVATEAFITLPFAKQHPLAITSHFFEFIGDTGRVMPVEALSEGGEYEVVVTTGGGLWRYRFGDRVQVTGRVGRTPSLKFLGRNGNVSDRFGEKLSELFIMETLREVFGNDPPCFALLAPDEDPTGCRYTLYVEAKAQAHWAGALDRVLRRNPHYAYCRDLGQLRSPRVFVIAARGYEAFASRLAVNGAQLGNIKPAALSCLSGWSQRFAGKYLTGIEASCLAAG